MLGIRASPKEESCTSAGEAALGNVLAVPGQLLPTAGLPADTPALPVVISVAKQTYDEAAATPARRGGATAVRQLLSPYLVLEKGPKVFKLQVGERIEVVSRDRLKPHAGQVPPAAAEP